MWALLWFSSLILSVVLNTQIAIRQRHAMFGAVMGALFFGLVSTLVMLALPLGRSRLCEYRRMRIAENARRCPYCQMDDPFTAPAP
ncbi:hypothetical protein [Sulfobacillus harzensis]|uniref:Uncharacterized protein n=1 Tax=Sulfobacillus harzensis TaxID=2729629 RepID=A0A7Y0Q0A0_9FIRM|nr:hypothetical protein [Sulfobacillus harzensis]NMP20778.1 hypothetical protein [Sulfobacillus harzensis]